jgi:hypothetical protein
MFGVFETFEHDAITIDFALAPISRRTDTDTGKDQTRRCRGEEYAFGVIFSLVVV